MEHTVNSPELHGSFATLCELLPLGCWADQGEWLKVKLSACASGRLVLRFLCSPNLQGFSIFDLSTLLNGIETEKYL